MATQESIPITEIKLKKIRKRDSSIVDFNFIKIADSIFNAAQSVGGKDRELAISLAHEVVRKLNEESNESTTVERVQDLIERTLLEHNHIRTAKAYILYQHQKSEERKRRQLVLGEKNIGDNLHFSSEALRVLERRYLLKDENGHAIETPREMIRRVARNLAQADKLYGATVQQVKELEDQWYDLMAELEFLPNSPTLMNAGTKTQQLSSCFVLPVEDSMESIFGSLHDAAIIHQRGSGTGFSFSRLRPKGDPVRQNQGVAAGPLSFLKVYNSALDVIKQGGIRPGANMAVLRVDHPDLIPFI